MSCKIWYVFLLCILQKYYVVLGNEKKQPHIILIVADDLGWNDIGFHGSNEISTPNIDALAYNGIILNRHYVLPTCTPSRTALMTGKYPIRTGLQVDPGYAASPWALPIGEKILPQYLKNCGYKTHLVGKWHLGFYQTRYTPTYRGFDSFFGYYNGWLTYNNCTVSSRNMTGFDARRNLQHAADEFLNRYVTDVFTDEAVNIIKHHDNRHPLFLEISHTAAHALKGDKLQVRNEKENNEKFGYIADKERRLFAGVLNALDESVGTVITALDNAKLLQNSIILFISDNGGSTIDPDWNYKNTASNWPLRGMKTSLYEGGIRGVSVVWSPLFKKTSYVNNDLFHISDWLPTFVSAAGGSLQNVDLDGVDQWNVLTGDKLHSDRKEILLNVNHERSNAAYIQNKWKLISCNQSYESTFADEYNGISGREKILTYNLYSVLDSVTNKALEKFTSAINMNWSVAIKIREDAIIDSNCKSRINANNLSVLGCVGDCLYDIENDPCEYTDISSENPAVVQKLKERLKYFESITVNLEREEADPKANPIYWDNYWSPWLGDNSESSTNNFINCNIVLITLIFIYKICRLTS